MTATEMAYVKYATMTRMTKKKAATKSAGRPPNIDPPKLFSTTLPTSVYKLLSDLSEVQHRTKSEVLTDALRAYARRFKENLPA